MPRPGGWAPIDSGSRRSRPSAELVEPLLAHAGEQSGATPLRRIRQSRRFRALPRSVEEEPVIAIPMVWPNVRYLMKLIVPAAVLFLGLTATTQAAPLDGRWAIDPRDCSIASGDSDMMP